MNDLQFFVVFYLLPGLLVFFLLPKRGPAAVEPTLAERLMAGGMALATVLLWPVVLLASLGGNRQ